MKEFAALYSAIDETTKTNDKVAAMVKYFAEASPEDAAWAVHFLVGRRPKRLVSGPKLWGWAAELAGLPNWLFGECYDAVGDLAETITLVLPDFRRSEKPERGLDYWVREKLLPLAGLDDLTQRDEMFAIWQELDRRERFVFNKLITGAFRVGVSQELVMRALSKVGDVAVPVIAHRLMGDWTPSAEFFTGLLHEETIDAGVSRPYPFCLAHPLEGGPDNLGDPAEWHVEWKWDGIRAQLIRREGKSFVWSRGEELITDRFPEILGICESLPDGTVLDGEILAWRGGRPLKFMELQKRIGRKVLSKKILQETPAALVAFDLLELGGEDIRALPFLERRQSLERLVDELNRSEPSQSSLHFDLPTQLDERLATDLPDSSSGAVVTSQSRLLLASRVEGATWEDLARVREDARNLNVEGFMIKRLDSPYMTGRKKGYWWKWKIDPFTVDAVLMYAQPGSGKRASLFTDYTFGVWSEGALVPFAKAYSGLDDDEIRRVDAFVRRNTMEKFGPVRTVKPELVMELAFEGIQLSTRHKSGIAVRFPRISRWRHDKKAEDADTLEGVKSLISP
ncbi:MAG TPA: ATP-dependent DNA ligase [Fimbriimonas sp.]|nr:ATP-dependent DNA ligase [Fimbriimonas sp.]